MPAVRMIEANAEGRVRSRSGWPFPPCIVIERGESLDKWAERLKPDFPTILQVRLHTHSRQCSCERCTLIIHCKLAANARARTV